MQVEDTCLIGRSFMSSFRMLHHFCSMRHPCNGHGISATAESGVPQRALRGRPPQGDLFHLATEWDRGGLQGGLPKDRQRLVSTEPTLYSSDDFPKLWFWPPTVNFMLPQCLPLRHGLALGLPPVAVAQLCALPLIVTRCLLNVIRWPLWPSQCLLLLLVSQHSEAEKCL